MSIFVKEPISEKEISEYYFLRWKILRKPLGQKNKIVEDSKEKDSIHAIVKDLESDKILGVGRLHFINCSNCQIRFMAVDENYQKKGYGKLILKFLEDKAKKHGCLKVILHSRESAVGFYKKHGYLVECKSHILMEKIQHWKMYKNI